MCITGLNPAPPFFDFSVIAAQEHFRHPKGPFFVNYAFRTGVDFPARDAAFLPRAEIAEDPFDLARDAVDDDHRGQFASGQDVIADGNILGLECLLDAGVDAFVAAADDYEIFSRSRSIRPRLRDFGGEFFSARSEEDNPAFRFFPFAFSMARMIGIASMTMPGPPP
jgi:hypothetical protein